MQVSIIGAGFVGLATKISFINTIANRKFLEGWEKMRRRLGKKSLQALTY